MSKIMYKGQQYAGDMEVTGFGTVQTTSGSTTVAAAQTYTLCSLTLAQGKKFLILATVTEGVGSPEITSACIITNSSGTPSVIYGHNIVRTTAASGQGVTNWRYMETGSGPVTVACQCYGYYTTSHTGQGSMIAICLGDI